MFLPSKYWDDVVSLGKVLHPRMHHLTQVKKVPGRTEMTMCPIISMSRDGGRTLGPVTRSSR